MFLVFEVCVGFFYPAYGVIKSEKIPENVRSTVMNIFRIPLNAFVVLLLLRIKYFDSNVVFGICSIAHFVALISYVFFYLCNQKGSTNLYFLLSGNDPLNAIERPRYGRASSELDIHLRELNQSQDEEDEEFLTGQVNEEDVRI